MDTLITSKNSIFYIITDHNKYEDNVSRNETSRVNHAWPRKSQATCPNIANTIYDHSNQCEHVNRANAEKDNYIVSLEAELIV